MFLRLGKFILPFALWIYLLRDFIFGRIPVNMDTTTIYSVTKFYFNNLLNGVVPLWDPFVLLGTPFYAITLCNLFNPVTQLVALGKLLGMNYYGAFMLYIIVYFFLGLAGFYCLAKEFFNDRRVAYAAYVMLLFSGIGVSLFNQFTIVELFVPAVWFFVFLLRFLRFYRPSDFLGLSYSAMIVIISYVPFYFATLVLCAAVLAGGLYFNACGRCCADTLIFVRRNMGLVIGCLAGIAVACVPLIIYKIVDSAGDVVSPGRHCNFASIEECYNGTLHEQGGMSYKETSQSGNLAERIDWRSFFIHLDKVSYGIDQFFYIPLLCYLILLLSIFVPLDRSSVFLAVLAALLSLIGLADAAPLHRFLYDHIFFFKYFRNLFFFQAYIIPLIILFTSGQLKRLWFYAPASFSARKAVLFWTVAAHAVVMGFFLTQDGIISTSWICAVLSLFVFAVLWLQLFPDAKPVLGAALIAALVVHPWEVFMDYAKNAQEFQCVLPRDHVKPQFVWVRPVDEAKSGCKIFKFVRYENFYNSMAMQDARGYVGFPVNVTRGAFLLSQWIDEKVLIDFTRYKLFLYDHVVSMDEDPLNIRMLGDIFANAHNAAYVIKPDEGKQARFNGEDWGQTPLTALQGPSALANVESFDVNHLKLNLNLPDKKFLVYTDGYTKFWKVFVNGREAKLIRANVGFKGVWVPEGDNVVEFRYQPPGGGPAYLTVSIALFAFLLGLFYLLSRERNWPWNLHE